MTAGLFEDESPAPLPLANVDNWEPAALDALILPETPAAVAAAYRELPRRAATEDFGLLEDDVIVLDTETTGLSPSSCRLIEIAALKLRGREVVGRFRTFVDPGMPIPPAIANLTGIHDVDVADAPDAETAVAALAQFVGGAPVLAHNATFDRTFVERVPGGHEVSEMWVDTLALSRIALPRLSTHRLQAMAEAFGCAGVTHRAMDDVDALAGMWRILLCALTDLPEGLLGQLANMHQDVDWAYRPILAHLAALGADVPFSLVSARRRLLEGLDAKRRPDVEDLDGKPSAPAAYEVEEAFSAEGAVSRMYESYEPRPEQLTMALEVRDALAAGEVRAIEAGTGVGKSVAYLLPLALYAKKNNVTCGVATKTNALTDQLVSHELPALAKVLPGGVSYYSLKGYDHYPCLRRLDRASVVDLPIDETPSQGRSKRTVASDMLTAIAVSYAYSCQSPQGDLDALGIRWGSVPRSLLTITSGECQRSRCPFFPNLCLLHGARRRAGSADIVVTNHSLLLRNVAAEGKVLPPIRDWVVDEAHSFEAEARKQWALEVSAERVRMAFESLGSTRAGIIHQTMAELSKVEAATPALGLLTKAATLSASAQIASADFFDAVRGLSALAGGNGGYDEVTLWLGEEARASEAWAQVAETGEAFGRPLNELANTVASAAEMASDLCNGLPGDLADIGRTLKEIRDALAAIVEGTDETYVYSAVVSRAKRRMGQERLIAEKLDIGAELAREWLPEMHSVTFSSATMAVDGDFKHFNHAVGIDLMDDGTHKELCLGSTYDFDAQMGVVVANDMPNPYDRSYVSALVDLLYDVHVAMGGSVLTLFTNRREMERVYAELAPRLSAEGLDLVQQERAANMRRLRNRFVGEKRLSMLALRSFWEGFDAAGDTLRCVVIPKLPFSSPKDPLVQERGARDRSAWRRWSLPEAVLSVKQAAGRLIRTSTDTGVLVLADDRLVSKGYGKVFLRSLPSTTQVELGRENVARYIKTWRSTHEH